MSPLNACFLLRKQMDEWMDKYKFRVQSVKDVKQEDQKKNHGGDTGRKYLTHGTNSVNIHMN